MTETLRQKYNIKPDDKEYKFEPFDPETGKLKPESKKAILYFGIITVAPIVIYKFVKWWGIEDKTGGGD